MEKFTNNAIREMRYANNDGILTVEGYATLWDSEYDVFDYIPDIGCCEFTERFAKGAFAKSIEARGGKEKKNAIKMLNQHKREQVLGTPELIEDDKGLFFRCEINTETDWGRNAAALIKSGDLKQISVGFNMRSYVVERTDDKMFVTHTEVVLHEFSLVTWAANEDAMIQQNRSNINIINTIRELGIENVRSILDAMTNTPEVEKTDATSTDGKRQFQFNELK